MTIAALLDEYQEALLVIQNDEFAPIFGKEAADAYAAVERTRRAVIEHTERLEARLRDVTAERDTARELLAEAFNLFGPHGPVSPVPTFEQVAAWINRTRDALDKAAGRPTLDGLAQQARAALQGQQDAPPRTPH